MSFSNRSQKTSKCDAEEHRCHFFVLPTFWRHLWSITEKTLGNMEPICQVIIDIIIIYHRWVFTCFPKMTRLCWQWTLITPTSQAGDFNQNHYNFLAPISPCFMSVKCICHKLQWTFSAFLRFFLYFSILERLGGQTKAEMMVSQWRSRVFSTI